MVTVVQLVRASDCGSECRGFESHRSPFFKSLTTLCCEGFFVYLPPPPFTPCCPPAQPRCGKAPVAGHSQRAPFPRALPLLSPLCVPNGLYPSGKCRPPTCPLAHVPQCPWLPKTICPASSSYAKRGKSSAWVGKGCPGADAFLEKTAGCCRNVHFLARGSACAHRNFSFFAFTLHLLV